jgi:hypothetical protein
MTSRRHVLMMIPAVGLVTACAGWSRITPVQTDARAPWTVTGPPDPDIRLDAFRYAILAPNPHNRQPWLIKLIGDDQALIACDLDRRLPQTDPFDRQITIGFGTFIELAKIAASKRGFGVVVTPFPDGVPTDRLDQRPVAHLQFRRDPAVVADPLFQEIPKRHTNRLAYQQATLTGVEQSALTREGVTINQEPSLIAQLRPLVVDAMITEMKTPPAWMETVNVMRIGAAAINATPDGLILEGAMIETLHTMGVVNQTQLANPDSFAFKTGLSDVKKTSGSFPAIAYIKTASNSRVEQLEAGYHYVRANLRATGLGLSMHPLSQALQEYSEMTPYFARVHDLLGLKAGERLQMLARIGKASSVSPSPRWPMEKHLIS